MSRNWKRLLTWEGFLFVLLVLIVGLNSIQTPYYLQIQNQINVFQLSIEKIIVAVIMTFIIINAEIDLSAASVMGLAACTLAFLWEKKVPLEIGIVAGLLAGGLAGLINGFFVARVGLPALVVTLAGLISYRGLARVLLEDRSVGAFPAWFNRLGQQPLIGPFPLALLIFFA